MAVLIGIEGIDGSGKGTQAGHLCRLLDAQGLRVGTLSFPRYQQTMFGAAIGRFLNGEFGTLDTVHPQLAALLFAGDRFESRHELQSLLEVNDVVVLDRYVASNVAHQASKRSGAERQQLIEFIERLEFDIYELPRPDHVVWLDVSVEWSQRLIHRKPERDYTDRDADLQEEDTAYMAEVRAVYEMLSQRHADWTRIDCCPGGELLSESHVTAVVAEVAQTVLNAASAGN